MKDVGIYEEPTWIISVISAMDCCLVRSSGVKVSPGALRGSDMSIYKAIDINNKTCIHEKII